LVEEVSDVQRQIVECIDDVLKLLGQSVSQVVYFHLRKNFGIKKDEIPNQPEAFYQTLKLIFGDGTKVIERLIVQKIKERFELRLEPETSLVEAMQKMKKAES